MTQVYKVLPLTDLVLSALQHGKAEKRKHSHKHAGGKPKLTAADILAIRRLANGRNERVLAEAYGVHLCYIRGIISGIYRTKHVI